MTATTEKASRKMFYSMGEVSEMFDVNPSLIRFWEKQFDVIKPRKNKKGNRLFTPADIENLKLIYHLVREKGMTLAGANQYIKDNKNALQRDIQIIERLQNIRAALLEIKVELGSDPEPGTTEIIVPTIEVAPAPAVETAPEAETSASPEESIEAAPTPEAEEEFTPDLPPNNAPAPAKPRFIEPTLF